MVSSELARLTVIMTGTTPKIVITRLSATVSPTLVLKRSELLIPNIAIISIPEQQIVAPVSPVPVVLAIVDLARVLAPGGDINS